MLKTLKYLFPVLTILLLACTEPEAQSYGMFGHVVKSMDKALENPENITSIILSEQGLQEFPKDLDGRFVNLIQLSLLKNKIKVLPRSIGDLSNLQSLHLEENQLTSIPLSIHKLKKLNTLILYLNQIRELPDMVFRTERPMALDLRWNKIERLPEHFTKSKISLLYLTGNPIKELPVDFGNLRELQTLNLANTEISELPESFYELSRLVQLDLRGTKLTEVQVKVLKEKLSKCNILSDFGDLNE